MFFASSLPTCHRNLISAFGLSLRAAREQMRLGRSELSPSLAMRTKTLRCGHVVILGIGTFAQCHHPSTRQLNRPRAAETGVVCSRKAAWGFAKSNREIGSHQLIQQATSARRLLRQRSSPMQINVQTLANPYNPTSKYCTTVLYMQ